MKQPSYPAYRPSGIDWLGDVPEHWEAGNIRRFARMKTGHTPSRQHLEYWENCTIPWFGLADVWQLRDDRQKYLGETNEMISELGLRNSAAELLPAGTVALSRTASVGFSGIMPVPMATTQDFWNWICASELLPEYLLLLFRAMRRELERSTMGSTHKTIYQEDAAALCICVPPRAEQRSIVHFVDVQTAKIDTLVDKKRALIEGLKEKRTALISQTVTCGLPPEAARAAGIEPHPRQQQTGVDWMGEVPAHWKVKPLGRLVRLRGGATPDKARADYWDGPIPWVSPKDMKRLRIADAEDHVSEDAVSNSALSIIPVGAVLIVVRGMILAHSFPVGLTEVPLTINQDMKVLIPGRLLNPRFLAWTLVGAAAAIVALADESAHGTRKLEASIIARFPIVAPPIAEQAAIADYLDAEISKTDELISKIETAIEILQQYRATMIFAAATGTIDVRDFKVDARLTSDSGDGRVSV